MVSGIQLFARGDVDCHAFALIAVFRFDHHGTTNVTHGKPSIVGIGHFSTARHRHPSRLQ